LIKGAVPGGRNSILMISGTGELKVMKKAAPVQVTEATPAPQAA
jgi:hypothetical protein